MLKIEKTSKQARKKHGPAARVRQVWVDRTGTEARWGDGRDREGCCREMKSKQAWTAARQVDGDGRPRDYFL